jgi:tetratricopeptide (TPR) repeat protein
MEGKFMGVIKHLLVIFWLGVVASGFGCTGSQHYQTGESLRPGFEVAYRPVYQPERQWNELVAAYNAHDKFDRIWIAMKSDYLAHSRFNIRNINFVGNRIDFTYILVDDGDDVGNKQIFSVFNYQLLKADIVVEFAAEGGIDRYAIIIPGVFSLRCRTLDTAVKLADLILFHKTKLREYVGSLDKQLVLFESVAAQYRALAVKPQISEEQRRLIVQANALTQQKNYTEAMEQYEKAIKLDLTAYPDAYYNLALLRAQENSPISAVFLMKRYLMLVPDAKDARSARDKIYEWEYLYQKK